MYRSCRCTRYLYVFGHNHNAAIAEHKVASSRTFGLLVWSSETPIKTIVASCLNILLYRWTCLISISCRFRKRLTFRINTYNTAYTKQSIIKKCSYYIFGSNFRMFLMIELIISCTMRMYLMQIYENHCLYLTVGLNNW